MTSFGTSSWAWLLILLKLVKAICRDVARCPIDDPTTMWRQCSNADRPIEEAGVAMSSRLVLLIAKPDCGTITNADPSSESQIDRIYTRMTLRSVPHNCNTKVCDR